MMANLAFNESNEKLLVEKIGNNCITFRANMVTVYKL